MSSFDAGGDENVRFFLAECREMLEDVEPKLIELETHSTATGEVDEDTVNLIFRLFHSLKGSAGFFGYSNIVEVTHCAETLLDLFRSGRSKLGPQHTDILCRTCDLVHLLLDQVEATGKDSGLEDQTGRMTEELSNIIEQEGRGEVAPKPAAVQILNPAPPAAPPAEEPEPEPVEVDDAGGFELELTDEMIERFIQESDEQLEQAEQVLLELEKEPDNLDDLAEAFRLVHSFKGNCGFMGYADLERLSHKAENVLGAIKDHRIEATKSNVPALLHIIDVLRGAMADIVQGGAGKIDNLAMLSDLMDDLTPPEEEVPKAPPAQPVRPDIQQPEAVWLLRESGPPDPPTAPAPAASPEEKKEDKPATPEPQVKSRSVFRQDIRVDLVKLDLLINLVGEMVIAESMVSRNPDLAGYEFENFERAATHMNKIVRDLQDVALSVRMIPIAGVFRRMIRLVHDLSAKAKKKVDLKLLGEETEIDKTVAEHLADPLVHLVRNSLDHGLEPPDERVAAGKDETGTIVIEAKHEGGEVWILISDDGRGLNREKILAKGIQNGLVKGDGAELSDAEVFGLIFEPGFSTADKVTDISGRGVGMDVVKKNIEKIKGRVDVHSTSGQGTNFILRIPLTLAIMEGMLVRVGRTRYTIPILSIRESMQITPEHITTTMDGQEVARVREELLPVVRLYELHKLEPDSKELSDGLLVILESRGEAFCVFVDEILGEQQTVIKGLSNFMGDVRGVSGCTILGDGEISLILDVGGLLDLAVGAGEPRAWGRQPRRQQ